MKSLKSGYNFDMFADKNAELLKAKKITLKDHFISNGYFFKMQDYLKDLKKELKTFSKSQPIDSKYYRNLLVVKNGELHEHYIDESDPFYPAYKHVQDLINIYDLKQESPALDENADISDISFFQSILEHRNFFLNDLNKAMCGKYSFKLNTIFFRSYATPEIQKSINNMILRHIDIQQDFLNDNLSHEQKNQREFISSTANYENLKLSYFQFCVGENNMQDMTILNYDEIGTNSKSETGSFDTSLHYVPEEFEFDYHLSKQNPPESIGLSRVVRDVGSDNIEQKVSQITDQNVGSNAFSPDSNFLLLVFFIMSLIFFRNRFKRN